MCDYDLTIVVSHGRSGYLEHDWVEVPSSDNGARQEQTEMRMHKSRSPFYSNLSPLSHVTMTPPGPLHELRPVAGAFMELFSRFNFAKLRAINLIPSNNSYATIALLYDHLSTQEGHWLEHTGFTASFHRNDFIFFGSCACKHHHHGVFKEAWKTRGRGHRATSTRSERARHA